VKNKSKKSYTSPNKGETEEITQEKIQRHAATPEKNKSATNGRKTRSKRLKEKNKAESIAKTKKSGRSNRHLESKKEKIKRRGGNARVIKKQSEHKRKRKERGMRQVRTSECKSPYP